MIGATQGPETGSRYRKSLAAIAAVLAVATTGVAFSAFGEEPAPAVASVSAPSPSAPAPAGAPPATANPAAGEVDPGTLTCQDCASIKRANPLLGTANLGVQVVLFAVFALVLYLMAVGFFKATITRGSSIVSSFVVAVGAFLVLSVLVAWVCFQQYTWTACWCQGLMVPEDGGPVTLSGMRAMKQVTWLYWGLALGLAVLLVLAISAIVRRSVSPAAGSSNA